MSDRKLMPTALSAWSILLGCATLPFFAAEIAQAAPAIATPAQQQRFFDVSLAQGGGRMVFPFERPKIKQPKPIFRPKPKYELPPYSPSPGGLGGSRIDRGWTYLFTPDYLGQKVHIRVVDATTGTGMLNNTTTDQAEIATPNCNPNSVVATQSTLYVACNKDIGNSDQILAYDISTVTQPTLSKTITSNQFDRLMALALDQSGNLWVSSYGNSKIARISSSSLASASPQVDKALVNSPSEPVGIAFAPDGSLWVASLYSEGIVVNISAADLNKTGLDPTFRTSIF